ncbi:MAG: malonate decarboxylase subunit epsilon [Paenibacillaceae bacterium]
MTTAFLFPGQGSQIPGMLHQLPKSRAVLDIIEEAASVLNADVYQYDKAEALGSTVAVQIALLVTGVATARLLMQEGGQPSYVAGHSVGAFGAAVTAGVLSFRDALLLVQLRATLMERLFTSGYGMGVIVGLGQPQVKQFLEEATGMGEQVYLGCVNSELQVTVAGTISGVSAVLKAAHGKGASKAEMLRVPVPSHCCLLDSVSASLEEAFSRIRLRESSIPYVANTTARLLRQSAGIRDDLIRGVARPVMWHEMTTQLYERGTRLYIEMPPGEVLSSLAKASLSQAQSVAASGTALESLLHLIRQENLRGCDEIY